VGGSKVVEWYYRLEEVARCAAAMMTGVLGGTLVY
jgi:hypothetical protein